MCRILILADIRPMGYKLSCCSSTYLVWVSTFYLNLFQDAVDGFSMVDLVILELKIIYVLRCNLANLLIFQGKPFATVIMDESTWTIEDKKLLRIQLVKADQRTKDQCWLSLLENQFSPDPIILNEMRKKLDLERFQIEVSFLHQYMVKINKIKEFCSTQRKPLEHLYSSLVCTQAPLFCLCVVTE